MTGSTKAIFLSYASQDADAARRIGDALREAGLEVWFDRSELRGPPARPDQATCICSDRQAFEKAGILREATGRKRGKLYVYSEYLAILNEGTEPE